MNVEIFKDYIEFTQRTDKRINGVSQKWLDDHSFTLDKLNLINCEGCWNCAMCTNCIACMDCFACMDCINCVKCINCVNCIVSIYAIDCTDLIV